jgi:hypothetical protein
VTPSDKSERSASHPERAAESTSTTTQTVDESSTGGADRGGVTEEGTQQRQSGDLFSGTETPPPWQRTATASSPEPSAEPAAQTESFRSSDAEDTQTIVRPSDPGGFSSAGIGHPGAVGDGPSQGRTAVTFGESAAGSSSAARRPSRGPRRASLQVKRVDPWSVLKLALVLSVALFFVWMIAVAVLYGVLDGMGVWDQLNGTLTELTQPDNAASAPLISAGRVFTIAAVLGGINAVLMTALATVAAFIYNVAADVAGGIEVTLSERE